MGSIFRLGVREARKLQSEEYHSRTVAFTPAFRKHFSIAHLGMLARLPGPILGIMFRFPL
jgi:hypothetical protein